MSVFEITPGTVEHACAMFPNLRPGDRRELDLYARKFEPDGNPLAAMVKGVERSIEAYAALVRGEPAAMWGITAMSALSPEGYVWLLTTPEVERHRKDFLRDAMTELRELRGRWHPLMGHVDPGYGAAMRSLVHWGFVVGASSGCPGLALFCDEETR